MPPGPQMGGIGVALSSADGSLLTLGRCIMALNKKLLVASVIVGGLIIQACAGKNNNNSQMKFVNPNLTGASVSGYQAFSGQANSSLSDPNNRVSAEIGAISLQPMGNSLELTLQ